MFHLPLLFLKIRRFCVMKICPNTLWFVNYIWNWLLWLKLIARNICIQNVHDIVSQFSTFTLNSWIYGNMSWKLSFEISNLKFFLKLIVMPWADGLGAIAIPPVSVCHQESTSNEFITCFSQILNLRIFLNKFYVSFFSVFFLLW